MSNNVNLAMLEDPVGRVGPLGDQAYYKGLPCISACLHLHTRPPPAPPPLALSSAPWSPALILSLPSHAGQLLGLDSEAYEAQLEEARAGLLRSVGVNATSPMDR